MVCYSGQLQHSVNDLSDIVYHKKVVDDYTRPAKYTGELIGIQYLFSQTVRVLEEVMGRDPDAPDGTHTDDDDDDEGFQEDERPVEEPLDNTLFGLEEDFARQPLSSDKSQSRPAIGASHSGPADQETSPGDEAIQRVSHEQYSLGPDTGPGYQHVVNLALSLLKLRHQPYMTPQQVVEIVTLWERLPEGDKAPVRFPPCHQERLVKGRFRRKHSQTSVTLGVESLRRCMGGQGSQAAQMPNISRLVETVCIELSRIHPEGTTICGVRVNRWAAVMWDIIHSSNTLWHNGTTLTPGSWYGGLCRWPCRYQAARPLLQSLSLQYAHDPRAPSRPLQFHNPRGQPPLGTPPCHMKHPSPSHSPRWLTLPLLRLHRRRQDPQYPAPLPGGGRKSRRWTSWHDNKESPSNKGK
ncbi:uncharacterized protein LOC127529723 [Erpetoichthys calabaricus]|uniref:uncharacterized protein LOC127529723 n=1 Tax=Erpetoichthys calabaricus TaxID=27687 RepID=UPI002234854D|nr:uncharacterized protein LOC127529723 [Erpetoichthys calabaricus]